MILWRTGYISGVRSQYHVLQHQYIVVCYLSCCSSLTSIFDKVGTPIRLVKDARGHPPFKAGTAGTITGVRSNATTPTKAGEERRRVDEGTVEYKFVAPWRSTSIVPQGSVHTERIEQKYLSRYRQGPASPTDIYKDGDILYVIDNFTYRKQANLITVAKGSRIKIVGKPLTRTGGEVKQSTVYSARYRFVKMEVVETTALTQCGTWLDPIYFVRASGV